MPRARFFSALLSALAALLLLFLVVPLVVMLGKETPGTLLGTFAEKDVRAALWVSIAGAAISTAIALLCGVPLGFLLARKTFRGRAFIQGVVDMPVVVPHTVAGIALLTVLGPYGVIGNPAGKIGIRFVDTLLGTIAAMLFVSAPFAINAARAGFEAVDERLEKVSRSLGASPAQTFFHISLPLAAGPIMTGAIMAWARAISEFGAVLIIAYYPRIGPTLIYERFTSFGLESSRPVAVLLVLLGLLLFIGLRLLRAGLRSWRGRGTRHA